MIMVFCRKVFCIHDGDGEHSAGHGRHCHKYLREEELIRAVPGVGSTVGRSCISFAQSTTSKYTSTSPRSAYPS